MIYVITCYFSKDLEKMQSKNFSYMDFTRRREWGYFFNKDTALKYVMKNLTDIYEHGYYNYVSIEERQEGILSNNKIWWYSATFNPNENSYNVQHISENFFTKFESLCFQKNPL